MSNGQDVREPWFSSILSQWVGKVGVPEMIDINLGWGPVYRAVFERLWRAKDGKFGRLS